MTDLTGARIGYVPYTDDHSAPGDRRRFAHWAEQRGITLSRASPGDDLDLVVLSARADISRWAHAPSGGPRLVYDLIDSYLTVPRGSLGDLARGTGKTLIRQHRRWTPSHTAAVVAMCRRADAVVCSTPEQQAAISAHCDDVRVILDVHDAELAPVAPRPRGDGVLRLFWEGLPQNLTGFAPALGPALRTLGLERPVELHVATDAAFSRWFGRVGRRHTQDLLATLPVGTVLHPWTAFSVPTTAAQCDIGVIPLDLDDAFASGKPENKLLLMWRLGLPVIASATPAYRRVMGATGHDLTCRTSDDWLHALRRLGDDASLREDVLGAARAYLDARHGGSVLLSAWDELVHDLLTRPPRPAARAD